MIPLLLMLAGQATDPPLNCKDPETQYAMNMCAGRDFERTDAAMNRQWAKTKAAMAARDIRLKGIKPDRDPSYVDALVAAQRAWLTFRDTQCRLEGYSMRGGSAQSLEISGCKTRLTIDRTQQLAKLIKDL